MAAEYVTVPIRIPRSVFDELTASANSRGTSFSTLVQAALRQFLAGPVPDQRRRRFHRS